jgi:Ca-activated chloride channel family protein
MTTPPELVPTSDTDVGFLLTAYADGELDATGVQHLEARLSADPVLRGHLDAIRTLQSRLRSGFAQQQVPRELDADIHGRILAQAARARPAYDRPRPARRWLAAAAIFLAVIGVPFLAVVAILLLPLTKLTEQLGNQADDPPMKVSTISAATAVDSDPVALSQSDGKQAAAFEPAPVAAAPTVPSATSSPVAAGANSRDNEAGGFGYNGAGGLRHPTPRGDQLDEARTVTGGAAFRPQAPIPSTTPAAPTADPTTPHIAGTLAPGQTGYNLYRSQPAEDAAHPPPPPLAPATPAPSSLAIGSPLERAKSSEASQFGAYKSTLPDERIVAEHDALASQAPAAVAEERIPPPATPSLALGKESLKPPQDYFNALKDVQENRRNDNDDDRGTGEQAQNQRQATDQGVVNGRSLVAPPGSPPSGAIRLQIAGKADTANGPAGGSDSVLTPGGSPVRTNSTVAINGMLTVQDESGRTTSAPPKPPSAQRSVTLADLGPVVVDEQKKTAASTHASTNVPAADRQQRASGAGGDGLAQGNNTFNALGVSEQRAVTRYAESRFDVHGVTANMPMPASFPGPDLSIPEPGAVHRHQQALAPDSQHANGMALIQIIQNVVTPQLWAHEGMAIEETNGTMSVQAPPEVHQQIAILLSALHQAQSEPPPGPSLGRASTAATPGAPAARSPTQTEPTHGFPAQQTHPPHVLIALEPAVGSPPDLLFLSHTPDDPVVEGTEYRLWHIDKDERSVVTVRVVKTLPEALLCRVIPDSWTGEPTRIDADYRAERLTLPGLARLMGIVTAPDVSDTGSALAERISLRARNDLASLLRQTGGEHLGLSATIPVVPQLDAPATVSVQNAARAQALLQLVRGAGLQAHLTGATLEIDTTQGPLDPTDLQGLDRKQFRTAFGTAPMMSTHEDARSTFAIDADTASYELTRQQLRAGRPIDPLTIRPEQFINAMPMDYPPAQGPEAFTLYAEAAPAPFASADVAAWSSTLRDHAVRPTPWSERTAVVAIGAVARPAADNERRPLHLTLAVDCSGSMAQEGGLTRIQIGLTELISHLRAEDRLALVAFGDQGRVVLTATSGAEHERLLRAVHSLTTGGATNCTDGLSLAYQLAAETIDPSAESRVVLCTDGGTLAGDGAAAVVERISAYRQRGISLLVLGCGGTAYQAGPLQELANKGGGQHVFLASDEAAKDAFAGRLLPQRLSMLAKDAKVQVTWNPQRVSHFRLIGYEERRLAHQDFRNDAVVAGQLSQDTQVTALYEVLLVEGASGPLGTAAVRYFDTRMQQVRELSCPMTGSVLASQASPRLRLLACAAEFAEYLQRGWWSNVHASSTERIMTELKRCPLPMARDLESLVTRAHTLEQRQGTP